MNTFVLYVVLRFSEGITSISQEHTTINTCQVALQEIKRQAETSTTVVVATIIVVIVVTVVADSVTAVVDLVTVVAEASALAAGGG